jgi:hypothetical protein
MPSAAITDDGAPAEKLNQWRGRIFLINLHHSNQFPAETGHFSY